MMIGWFKGKSFANRDDEIDQLTQTINEESTEQKRMIEVFKTAMNDFAAERSLETCLAALNASMQIASIRGKLVESYEYYARLLEREVLRLNKSAENSK